MSRVIVDFETFNEIGISGGQTKYVDHPSLRPICLAFKRDDESTLLWLPGDPIPQLHPTDLVYAHNASFDFKIWMKCFGDKSPTMLSQWRDTMALCGWHSLPLALGAAAKALGLPVQKDTRGKQLIKKICTPGMLYTDTDLRELYAYCKTDVNTTHALLQKLLLSRLSSREEIYWRLTYQMNAAGLPIDEELVRAILRYITVYQEEMTNLVPELSQGQVQKVTQIKKLKDYVSSILGTIPDLKAETVSRLVSELEPSDLKTLLILRQELGRSSTAKFVKILEYLHHGRVHDNLVYYGAGPGRWAGRGFQLQNLPRATVPDPEDMILKFKTVLDIEDPINKAKALIRACICAPGGYSLIVSDYKAIENRMLAFMTQDTKTLELFERDLDQYIDMAAYEFKIPEDEVTKDQRQFGKVLVLGCGYQMGGPRFQEVAKDWGFDISLERAKRAVYNYRKRYWRVKRFWAAVYTAAKNAILTGQSFTTHGIEFQVEGDWFTILLASGRKLIYYKARMEAGTYGPEIQHFGVDPKTKQWVSYKVLSPGRITENIDQGQSRDIMANGLYQVSQKMPEVQLLGTVHDEVIGLISKTDITVETLNNFNTCLCNVPFWAKGLPLQAEGYIAKRYKKG